MSRFARTYTLMLIVSRLMARGARTRAGVRCACSRVIATVTAAILFGAQISIHLQHDATADEVRSFSTAAPFAALHSPPTNRFALEPRSSTRPPSSRDVPSPEYAQDAFSRTIEHHIAVAAAIGFVGQSAVARGYDATAPPALS